MARVAVAGEMRMAMSAEGAAVSGLPGLSTATCSLRACQMMQAIRRLDEPYPLHGCEVAIRYCAPSNGASRLSPEAFAQYLREPWYRIMAEWDEIEERPHSSAR